MTSGNNYPTWLDVLSLERLLAGEGILEGPELFDALVAAGKALCRGFLDPDARERLNMALARVVCEAELDQVVEQADAVAADAIELLEGPEHGGPEPLDPDRAFAVALLRDDIAASHHALLAGALALVRDGSIGQGRHHRAEQALHDLGAVVDRKALPWAVELLAAARQHAPPKELSSAVSDGANPWWIDLAAARRDLVPLLEIQRLPDGTKVAVVPCADHDAFMELPDAVEIGSVLYRKTSWNSDRGVAYYRTDGIFGRRL